MDEGCTMSEAVELMGHPQKGVVDWKERMKRVDHRPQSSSADLLVLDAAARGCSGLGVFRYEGIVYFHGENAGERFLIDETNGGIVLWGRDYRRIWNAAADALVDSVISFAGLAMPKAAVSEPEPVEEPVEEVKGDYLEDLLGADSTAHEEATDERLGPLPGAGAPEILPEVEMPKERHSAAIGDLPVFDAYGLDAPKFAEESTGELGSEHRPSGYPRREKVEGRD